MNQFLWICLAGAAGTGCRRLVGIYAPRLLGAEFPWATLIVNVVGCFLISLVAHVAVKKLYGDDLRLALMTGFMGGLTTYSSFNFETTNLLFKDHALLVGGLNVALTLALCFGAGLLGTIAGRWLVGA
jgi:CrcB protein